MRGDWPEMSIGVHDEVQEVIIALHRARFRWVVPVGDSTPTTQAIAFIGAAVIGNLLVRVFTEAPLLYAAIAVPSLLADDDHDVSEVAVNGYHAMDLGGVESLSGLTEADVRRVVERRLEMEAYLAAMDSEYELMDAIVRAATEDTDLWTTFVSLDALTGEHWLTTPPDALFL